MRRLQDHLLLASNLLGRHLDAVRRVGEEAIGSEFTSDKSKEPLDDSSSPALGGLHSHIRRKEELCKKGTL